MATDSKSTKRRDFLVSLEKSAQDLWWEGKAYESEPDAREHFMCTFPYPYMNGRLHLGHLFTITKAEFSARYQRLLGKNVLFPFAFHCTGMPIKASADHLRRELASGTRDRQYVTMKLMGIQEEEIENFVDAGYWLQYFPPRVKYDLQKVGLAVDWRRSFITTEVNPFYDSFVRW
jgi:leucyl-tRNA synthetase